jgi:hypothetical protein
MSGGLRCVAAGETGQQRAAKMRVPIVRTVSALNT